MFTVIWDLIRTPIFVLASNTKDNFYNEKTSQWYSIQYQYTKCYLHANISFYADYSLGTNSRRFPPPGDYGGGEGGLILPIQMFCPLLGFNIPEA
jgi:hypothetical protein